MTEFEMEKLVGLETDILKAFIEVCNQLNLTYYAVYGTALGAVRHQGFIPWDDDVDVAMPRPDYEKFMEQAQALLPRHLFLQTNITDPEYPLAFAKIRNCDTTFIEKKHADRNMNHGVYIDVFPIDGYPDSKLGRWWMNVRFRLTGVALERFQGLNMEQSSMANRLAEWVAGILYPTEQAAVRARITLMKQYPCGKTKLAAEYAGAVIFPWYLLGKGREVPFEDLTVRIPEYSDAYLTLLYGDYRKFPPEKDRIPCHECSMIDLDCPYTHYRNKA